MIKELRTLAAEMHEYYHNGKPRTWDLGYEEDILLRAAEALENITTKEPNTVCTTCDGEGVLHHDDGHHGHYGYSEPCLMCQPKEIL